MTDSGALSHLAERWGLVHDPDAIMALVLTPTQNDPDTYDNMNHHCDVLIVGAGHVGWEEFGGSICGLFTFAQHHCCTCLQAELVQSKQWARFGQALPAPLSSLGIGALAPR